ncbi:MAG: hypothetical protein COT92_00710 [Candidatus Doudnabacteria bacterium CG10_big_fil_rev_8_21_14_0_10_42_18]|uniref:NYN domain-containing protein n=1 Tax=Candidatus Doudnabacteria bacterium CG10_big_fil_rev_8_21_14_0_10_42_18 TaxID=1974552 RepID=A0A2H0VBN3_9BACT|nr:MAG: hypothetical protein COT92_00710 [Candidatus Doudnabacteria bacterium CG10_big_fil_rev_8_21_14_0_10_42_18]
MSEIKKQKIAVFIDGSNLYFKLRSLKLDNLSRFDYRKFVEWLSGDREIIFIGYYIGVVRAKLSDVAGQKLRRAQINLFNFLGSNAQRITVRRGYLMNSGGAYHEKGVDVQIATDLLVGAYENLYDFALVISSDTDLLPAISKVKSLGKEVEYVGFGHQPSLAMQTGATISKLILKEELEAFIFKEK